MESQPLKMAENKGKWLKTKELYGVLRRNQEEMNGYF